MPKITYLKEIEGSLWARLELNLAVDEGPVHVFTEKEIRELKSKERKDLWDEIQEAVHRYDDRDVD